MGKRRETGRRSSAVYVLRRGDEGAQRLRLLARVKWPTTREALRKAGLRKGMKVLDVGCGIGETTFAMARMIGPTGKVEGIDCDESFVRLARREAARRRLKAEFQRADALDLRHGSAYDLVYARYLLTHLAEPRVAFDGMVKAAKPGGAVVVEDIDFPGHFCYPPCRAFARYVELYQAVVRRNGGDPAIGPRLHVLFMESGLRNVQVDVVQPTYREGEGKRVASVTMEHIREALVQSGLASNAEVDSILSELDLFVRNPSTIMSIARTVQVWGQKPA